MKKSYEFVPAPTVTACKKIARALIKRDLAFHFPSYEDLSEYVELNAPDYALSIIDFMNCSHRDFSTDFEEWMKHEIIKIYRKKRKYRHES